MRDLSLSSYGSKWLLAWMIVAATMAASGQTNEWTWVSGNSALPAGRPLGSTGWAGVYGSLGVPAASNAPGGRSASLTWTDRSGNLWLFGGEAFDANGTVGFPNDLWMYSTSSRQWIWEAGSDEIGGYYESSPAVFGILGTPAKTNTPSGRMGAMTWTDSKGNLWLFGGMRYDSPESIVYLNDLWVFNPGTLTWTWMAGSSETPPDFGGASGIYGVRGSPAAANVPGARDGAITWVDLAGNFWLFGGYGFDALGAAGELNDLWKYNPSSHQWTWISGADTIPANSQPLVGVYGTEGMPAPENVPGARSDIVGWRGPDGRLWMIGGHGWDSGGNQVLLNDLWVFDPAVGQWAWMGGSTDGDNPGVYGTLQVPSATNIPGARDNAVSWTDAQGNFWLMGGYGEDQTDNSGLLNDLWEYNPIARTWTWISGSSVLGINGQAPGIYGAVGISRFGDTPGARNVAMAWTDAHGNLWLMGGSGVDSLDAYGDLNDLWVFALDTGGQPQAATPVISPGSGAFTTVQTVTISDTTPGATIQYLVDGAQPPKTYTGPFTLGTSSVITAMASSTGYANSPVATATYTLNLPSAARPVFSVPAGSYSGQQKITISDATPGAIIYFTEGGNPTTDSTVYSGPIAVSTSVILQAIAVAPGYSVSLPARAEYDITPTGALGKWEWLSGSDVDPPCSFGAVYCGYPGVYGTLGTGAAANVPGGRWRAATWTDAQGGLWMFGGEGFDSTGAIGLLNDLWRFNTDANVWTWVDGGSALGSKYALPGTYGVLGVGAAGNLPGGRTGASTWTDASGNFWLFGGEGADAKGWISWLNDLWRFNPSTNLWTWMGGSSVAPPTCSADACGQPGIYGALGVSGAANIPGGRSTAVHWTDVRGNLWLFGGMGFDSAGIYGSLNDLWKYDPSSQRWTWMSGSDTMIGMTSGTVWYGRPGQYGFQGMESPYNVPGGRIQSQGWTDASGNLWLMGGWGYDYRGWFGFLNDRWKFNVASDEWTWMGGEEFGSGVGALSADYGEEGVAAPTNAPTIRADAAYQVDKDGEAFWMFGGFGLDQNTLPGNVNELWRFDPAANEWTWMNGGPGSNPQGTFGTKGVSSPTNIPGIRLGAASWMDGSGNLWIFGGNTHTNNAGNDLWKYSQPVKTATPSFSVAGGMYTSAQTVALSDATTGAVIHYTSDGSAPTTSSSIYSGAIAVSSTETLKAVAIAPDYAVSAVASATYTINLPPPTFTLAASSTSLSVSAGATGTTTLTVTPANGFKAKVSFACSGLPAGASCAFNPATVTPAGGAVTSTLMIATPAHAMVVRPNFGQRIPEAALAFVVCFVGWRRRRYVGNWPLLAMAMMGIGLITACGSGSAGGTGGGAGGPTSVTSTVTVSATSDALQQSVTLTLTVN